MNTLNDYFTSGLAVVDLSVEIETRNVWASEFKHKDDVYLNGMGGSTWGDSETNGTLLAGDLGTSIGVQL